MTSSDSTHPMPAWAQELSKKIFSRSVSQFILYNNVRDLVAFPEPGKPGQLQYQTLADYLARTVFADRSVIILYDISKGIYFANPAMQADFFKTMQLTQQDMMRQPSFALKAMEIFIRLSIEKKKSVAVIMDHAEMIVPMTLTSAMSLEDRKCIVMLKKWANDPNYFANAITVCLITDNLSDLNDRIVRNTTTEKIEIEYPDAQERLDYIRYYIQSEKNLKTDNLFEKYSWVTPEQIAHTMAGLNRRQLQKLMAHARENGDIIDFVYLVAMKKNFIEEESFGLLEIIQPKQNLDAVAGYDAIKQKLRNLAQAMKAGKHDTVPMGYLFSGPVGTGKTFLVLSFVGEIGVPCVKFLNFREQWVGVTEANLEKILNLLKAMWPIGVIIDEADAFLGDRNEQGDSGTSSRVFAQLASFMGDTYYRGKVIWFLITCRPDLLPIDMKRQGRAEEHIGVFYPDTEEEKEALFRAMLKKFNVELEEDVRLSELYDIAHPLSGADMESLITRVRMELAIEGKETVSRESLKKVFGDFIPTNDPESIELQTLAAVIESTSKALLPEKYREADRSEIRRRFDALKREDMI